MFAKMQKQVLRNSQLASPLAAAPLPVRRHGCAAFSWRIRTHTAARRQSTRCWGQPAVCMGIKAVESYDGAFQLEQTSEQLLKTLLSNAAFCSQVRNSFVYRAGMLRLFHAKAYKS